MLTTLRLTESSLCDKTTHVHASIISFHLFTCKLHILSCSKLCRQLPNAYRLPDWYSVQIHQQPIASRFRLHRVCQNPVSTGWLVTIWHSISSNTLQAHPHTARAADALRVGRWRTEQVTRRGWMGASNSILKNQREKVPITPDTPQTVSISIA